MITSAGSESTAPKPGGLWRVLVGDGTPDNPNAGVFAGNGYSWTAETCTGTTACNGGNSGIFFGNGGDGFNGGNGGSAGWFGNGGNGGNGIAGVDGGSGGNGANGGLFVGDGGNGGNGGPALSTTGLGGNGGASGNGGLAGNAGSPGLPGPSRGGALPTLKTKIAVGDSPTDVAFAADGLTAYVADNGSGSISVIDTRSRTVTTTLSVGNQPEQIAVNPVLPRVYATTRSEFGVVELNTYVWPQVWDAIRIDKPRFVAVNPAGTRAYVSNGADTVYVVETATSGDRVIAQIKIGTTNPYAPESGALVVSPDGQTVYVANKSEDTIAVIDTATNTVIKRFNNIGAGPSALAITPDGRWLYCANSPTGFVHVINPVSGALEQSIKVGIGVTDIAISGNRAYVTVPEVAGDTGLIVLDTTTHTMVGKVVTGREPRGVAVHGNNLYVADSAGDNVWVYTF